MRKRIETFKAGIAFIVFILCVACIDSDLYYIAFGIVAILSLVYLKIVAGRIMR